MLHGVRVVEMAGLGLVSFTGMLLANVGTLRVRTKVVLALQPSLVFGRMTDSQARTAFVELAGELQPAPAPRFAATPSRTCPRRRAQAREVLAAWGTRPP